jgi:hypothetical protein
MFTTGSREGGKSGARDLVASDVGELLSIEEPARGSSGPADERWSRPTGSWALLEQTASMELVKDAIKTEPVESIIQQRSRSTGHHHFPWTCWPMITPATPAVWCATRPTRVHHQSDIVRVL